MTNIIKRSNDMLFPAVFGWDIVDKLFDDSIRGQLFEQHQGYPTDIVEIRDERGKVTAYEVAVTLAGIPRENVEVSVEKDTINIQVRKSEKEESRNRSYLRKGISQRSMQLRYGLHGIDKEKIKATLADGMLRVELPLAEEAKPKMIEIG